jgi:hypothetical protein
MKTAHLIVLAGLAVAAPATSQAQVAGSTFLGSTYAELRDVTVSWSAKQQIIGPPVFNDLNERIGSIDDVIVTPDKSISYAIIKAGGFLAVTKHDVAVPVSQLKLIAHELVRGGYLFPECTPVGHMLREANCLWICNRHFEDCRDFGSKISPIGNSRHL